MVINKLLLVRLHTWMRSLVDSCKPVLNQIMYGVRLLQKGIARRLVRLEIILKKLISVGQRKIAVMTLSKVIVNFV